MNTNCRELNFEHWVSTPRMSEPIEIHLDCDVQFRLREKLTKIFNNTIVFDPK